MAAARIFDTGVAIDTSLIIWVCRKMGFYGAQKSFRKFSHETCVKWNLYRTEFCGFYVMCAVDRVIFNIFFFPLALHNP